jgi:hypothetical protein
MYSSFWPPLPYAGSLMYLKGKISPFPDTYQRLFLMASRQAFLARANVPRNLTVSPGTG